jgi:phosphonatase-like hydrolase
MNRVAVAEAPTSAAGSAVTANTWSFPVKPQLVVLDMAGSTVTDNGLVTEAFQRAIAAEGIEPDHQDFAATMSYVHRTMGASKWSVFLKVFEGDRGRAARANDRFERAYQDSITTANCGPIPGAVATIEALKAAGLKVCLTTGFSPGTRQALIQHLGWETLVDLALSPADGGFLGRGRPYPDMILTALTRLGASSVQAVATAGDTVLDIRSGRAAGAGYVAGLLTGAHNAQTLRAASPDAVLPSVIEFGSEILVSNGD